jgi:hypothetical protein
VAPGVLMLIQCRYFKITRYAVFINGLVEEINMFLKVDLSPSPGERVDTHLLHCITQKELFTDTEDCKTNTKGVF